MFARVEPLTTTRRLSGPFDYKADGRRWSRARSCASRSATRQLDGVVVGADRGDGRPRGEAAGAHVGPRRHGPARPGGPGALDRRGVLLHAGARARDRHAAARARRRRTSRRSRRARRASSPTSSASCSARLPGPAGKDLPRCGASRRAAWSTISERSERRTPRTNAVEDRAHDLTQPQIDALAAIERGRHAPAARRHRLGQDRGLPARGGGGLDRGEGVIVLVPEIALTPQTVARFAARFGDTVALLHSALSEGERYDEWRRLRTGEARIAVGPRWAVFAPVDNLGLIVVDEEHDASYKQDGDPRYDARHVAAYRAYQSRGCAAARRPELHASRLRSRRVRPRSRWSSGRPAPPGVTRRRPRTRVAGAPTACRPCASWTCASAQHSLHPETRRALRRHAQVDRPAQPPRLVELPHRARRAGRRGSARAATSRWSCTAPQHEIACHHCGHKERVPKRCDACGSLAVARHGAGTERVEHELRGVARRPGLPPRRRHRRRPRTPCPSCSRASTPRPTGLLLGTQMVAKGHDFPDVTLGVVLDADSTLRFPDFRAEERTFALIAQLAGRAGRGPEGRARARADALARRARDPGRRQPRHRRLPQARSSSAARRSRYPPFADLIRVITSATDAEPARAAAAADRRGRSRCPEHRAARPGAAVPPARPRALPDRAQDPRARATRSTRPARRSRPPRATRRSKTSISAWTSTRSRHPRRFRP